MGVKANPPLRLRFFAELALGRETAEPELEPDLLKKGSKTQTTSFEIWKLHF